MLNGAAGLLPVVPIFAGADYAGRMPMPILYSFRRCPYAMRARMALLVAGVRCELREVKLSAKPAEMIAASAKATVPVLVTDEGATVIDQSLDIMRWALGRADPEGWLAGDDVGLIAANDGAFKAHLDRYKYPHRYADREPGIDPIGHRDDALATLAMLDRRLQACGGQLRGPSRSLADIAIFPFIRQFAEVDRSWFDARPLPSLQRWLAGHLASPLFAAAMVRPAPWQPGDAPVIFG